MMNPSFLKIGRTSPPLCGTSSTALRFGNHLEKDPYHRKRSPRETSPPLRGTSSTALRFGNRLEKEPYHRKRSPRETSPPLRGTSSTALRFGNHLALPCGQHLMGQKGPIRGGFEGFLALEFA